MIASKKQYVRPDFNMMYFNLSDNIAATGCTSTSTTTYEKQLITCIIGGSEYVFYSGCATDGGANVTSGFLGTYDGKTYFVWYDGTMDAKPSSEQEELLTNIENAVGASSAVGQPGWHAGVASGTISSIWNSSY